MKLRHLRGRFGITAPRVAVTTHIPWYWRAAMTLLLLTTALLLAGWIYDKGRSLAGFERSESDRELDDLRGRVSQLAEESARFRNQAIAGESKVEIEKTAQQDLSLQIKTLEAENNRLREDLAVFERLAAADPTALGVSIYRLEVEPDAARGSYHYRMLLSAQGNARDKDFQGRLRFVATVIRGGKTAMLTVPEPGDEGAAQYALSFRHFRRIEGSFKLPADAVAQAIEANVLQNGSVVATERVSL